MQVDVKEENLEGFNDQAKSQLIDTTHAFVSDLIEEANRLESKNNSSGASPEITSSNVNDAADFVRRGLTKKKKGFKVILLRILATLSPLVIGIMYNTESLQNGAYLLTFVVVVVVAVLSVTLSTIME